MSRSASASAPTAAIEGKFLVIRLPLEIPAPSASGKTMVLASTHGNLTTEAKWEGRPIIIGVNAYFK